MGRSTVSELISKLRNRNDYNNTAVDTDAKVIEGFNAALQDLSSDLNLTEQISIPFVTGTREYDLPDDFLDIYELRDGFGLIVEPRRFYSEVYGYGYRYPQGYFILNKGINYVIDLFEYTSDQTFSGLYKRYPATLSVANLTDRPEVPTIGEDALIEYAIMIALRNNNQLGQAQIIEQRYEALRKKIRDVAQRQLAGG